MTLTDLARMDEDTARAYLESVRWPNGPFCPHCGSVMVTRLQGSAHRAGLLKCNDCREQFTVTVGTIFESSHIPLQKWLMAFHLMCSSKKGISSLQLQRELSIGSYRTALFMTHRIREAMDEPLQRKMQGIVEMDEAYIGGKPRARDGKPHKAGRGTSKACVVGMLERGGQVEMEPIKTLSIETLSNMAREHADASTILMTDENSAYRKASQGFAGHMVVRHGQDQFVAYTPGIMVTTNGIEGFFSLLKRGHYGVYHKMSKKHLRRYCREFCFRYNHRKMSDSSRTEEALKASWGKRLTYRQMVDREV